MAIEQPMFMKGEGGKCWEGCEYRIPPNSNSDYSTCKLPDPGINREGCPNFQPVPTYSLKDLLKLACTSILSLRL